MDIIKFDCRWVIASTYLLGEVINQAFSFCFEVTGTLNMMNSHGNGFWSSGIRMEETAWRVQPAPQIGYYFLSRLWLNVGHWFSLTTVSQLR